MFIREWGPWRCAVILAAGCAALGAAPSHGTSPLPGMLVVDQRAPALLRVDGSSGRVEARADTGVDGHEVVISPDGRRAYVPIYSDAALGQPGTNGRTIEIYDTADLRRLGSIDLGQEVRPHHAAFDDRGLLWVTAEAVNSVFAVDVVRRKVVAIVPIGEPQAHMIAISPDGRRAYTANVSAGTVSVIDTARRRHVATIKAAPRVQRVSVSRDGKRVFTHDNAAPRLIVIDAKTNRVERTVDLPERGYASAPTHDGKRLLIVSPFAQSLYVLDLAAMKVEHSINIGHACGTVSVTRRDNHALLSCGRGQVVVVDLIGWRVERTIETPLGTDGLALLEK